ncbi:hypothetical protein AKJ52_00485 [candidate division MSBL1 archaeon SCGC-AAA382C18]|uniref:Transcription regulator PadR N-terminal domain-containing protein n=1 Tax=candidate division MSBL1 archaeon SCGC-AAA382C18 TaxID=1698281 RepID=A0A133VLK9_9EURY|nr:hypothetical protein AKJ52_00485 [candidate division MSBL1 archaeon SCGC-AAA382C18]
MLKKKLLPLALIYTGGEAIEGRTRLQKMIFLAQQDMEDSVETYDYEPYDYGPFSKELYDDIDDLVDEGIIKEQKEKLDDGRIKYFYEMSEEGQEIIESKMDNNKDFHDLKEKMEDIKSTYNKKNLRDLLNEVYSRYPKYAEESVF